MSCISVTIDGRTRYFSRERIEALMKKHRARNWSWASYFMTRFAMEWMDLYGDDTPSGDVVIEKVGRTREANIEDLRIRY